MFLFFFLFKPSLHGIDIYHYHIQLEVSDSSTYIKGFASLYFQFDTEDEKVIELLLNASLNIDSLVYNGHNLPYYRLGDTLLIDIKSVKNRNTLSIYYDGEGKGDGRNGVNTAYIKKWNQNVTWTLSEPFYTKNWLPSTQNLIDKIDSVKFTLITKNNLKAVSNGLLSETQNLPNNRISYTWITKYPIAYYLISFAVSDYLEYTTENKINGENLVFSNFIYNSNENFQFVKKDIDSTWLLLNLYSNLYGTYPFIKEKYGHAQAPLGGGMEHQTLTTISNFNFELVAHELAHQWWGNLVTCNNWSNIWINESFATYSEYLAYEFLGMKEKADDWMAITKQNVCSYNEGSVYIFDSLDSKSRIFNQRLSYNKGAMVIHMLRNKIGNDQVFFSILQNFLKKYAFKNAGTLEFLECAEFQSGMELNIYFDDWIYGEGFPEITIKWKQTTDYLFLETAMDRDYEINQDLVCYSFGGESKKSQIILNRYLNYDTIYFSNVIRQVSIANSSKNLVIVKDIANEQTNSVLNVVYNGKDQKLEFYKSVEWPITIRIINIQGKNSQNIVMKNHYLNMDMSEKSKGCYFVHFMGKQEAWNSKKVIVY